MPGFVVVVAPGEVDELTLAEWDRLCTADTVRFEDETHPLRDRLLAQGVQVIALDGSFVTDDAPIVIDPDSTLIDGFLAQGATFSVGPAVPPDGESAARGARIGRRAARSLSELALVMARLRGPGGCPWDHEQTHASLQVHLLEEAHEVLEAIDESRLGSELEEELGDLLLQVVFHAQIAADEGRFDIDGVARRLVAKLVHRHPHVFGETTVAGASEVVANWETLKAEEKSERTGPFDGIPAGLPALLSAYKTQKRATALGFTGEDASERAKQALAEDDLGDALFWVVALCRAAGVDPEGALRRATALFRDSF